MGVGVGKRPRKLQGSARLEYKVIWHYGKLLSVPLDPCTPCQPLAIKRTNRARIFYNIEAAMENFTARRPLPRYCCCVREESFSKCSVSLDCLGEIPSTRVRVSPRAPPCVNSLAMDLSPDPLLSPSKAAHAISVSRSWSHVDGFLAPLFYPSPIPTFERNEATLNALLALTSHSEDLTEQHALLANVKAKALHELHEAAKNDPDANVLDAIEENLTSEEHEALDSLASLSAIFGGLSSDPDDLAVSIVKLTRSEFETEQQIQHVDALHKHLEVERVRLLAQLEELRATELQIPPKLLQRTSERTRGTKQLSIKLREYEERVVRLEKATRGKPDLGIPEIKMEERATMVEEERIQGLEDRVKAFRGLPADKELALLEVERTRRELEELTRRRDSLFEALVEDGRGGA